MAANVSVHILSQDGQNGSKISTAYLPRESCISLERARKWIEYNHSIKPDLQSWYTCLDDQQLNMKQADNGELLHDDYFLYVDVGKRTQESRLVAQFNRWMQEEPNNNEAADLTGEQQWFEVRGDDDSFHVLKDGSELHQTPADNHYDEIDEDYIEPIPARNPPVRNETRVMGRVRKTLSDTCHICSEDNDLYYCYTCEDDSTTSCVFCASCLNTMHHDLPFQHEYEPYHKEGGDNKDSGVADNSYKTDEQTSGDQPPNYQAPPRPRQATPPATPDVVVLEGKWICTTCTYVNDDWRPGCEICSTDKPEPKATQNQQEHYDEAAVDENYAHYVDPDPGWTCERCTMRNLPRYKFCTICLDGQRPIDYQEPPGYQPTPEEIDLEERQELSEMLTQEALAGEEDRERNFQEHVTTFDQDIFVNQEEFECPICFDAIEPEEGVILRECHHEICRDCLKSHIEASEQAEIACPGDGCEMFLLEREIKQIAPDALARIEARSLQQAEAQCANAFHCKTSDCTGWCETTDEANFFECEVCNKKNCLTCKAQHEGQNCKEYQDELKLNAQNDADAQATQQAIDQMLADGDAMKCPKCSVILMKKAGCDWMQCSVCKLEICWVTKQARWGPKGHGDTSGGCQCNWANNNPCAPNCGYCH